MISAPSLVYASGGITDTFDIFIGPGTDNIGFTEYTGTFMGVANLPANTWYLEHTADTIYFHYMVDGTVPEPGTLGLLLFGLFMWRGFRDTDPLNATD